MKNYVLLDSLASWTSIDEWKQRIYLAYRYSIVSLDRLSGPTARFPPFFRCFSVVCWIQCERPNRRFKQQNSWKLPCRSGQ